MKKADNKMRLVDAINLYIHKNYFLNFRKQFLEILKQVGPKLGINISYERQSKACGHNMICDIYTLHMNEVELEMKEYGDPLVKKGKMDDADFYDLVRTFTITENLLFKVISKELKDYKLEPFVIYAALMEAMNNFRFKVDHLKTFLKETVEVKGNNLIIKDKKGTLSFKLIKKLSPRDLWKAYHSFKGNNFVKILEYGSPEKFMLGRPFIFVLKEEDVNYKGKVKNILKDIRKLLSLYFSDFMKMNMYEVDLSYEDRGMMNMLLIKLSEKYVEALSIMKRNLKAKKNIIISDEEKDWFLKTVSELIKKYKEKNLGFLNPLLKAVSESKLVKQP